MKQAILSILFFATTIKTASYWFTIGDGVDNVISMTVSGPNGEYADMQFMANKTNSTSMPSIGVLEAPVLQ